MLLLLCISSLSAQTHYTGFVDKYPVELVLTDYSGTYMYKKTNTPVRLGFELKNNTLILSETVKKKKTASLVFENFDRKQLQLNGTWTNLQTKQKLNIRLTKDPETQGAAERTNKSVLQAASLPDKYFLTLLSINEDKDPVVTGLKIIDKKTDQLLQTIEELDCTNIGIDNVSVEDYNFDGYPDFSIHEKSYVGANATSLYYLYDPKSKTYYDSGFSGMSLSFDHLKKRIVETNQCCGGTEYKEIIYKLVKNNMVEVSSTDYKWNSRKKTYIKK